MSRTASIPGDLGSDDEGQVQAGGETQKDQPEPEKQPSAEPEPGPSSGPKEPPRQMSMIEAMMRKTGDKESTVPSTSDTTTAATTQDEPQVQEEASTLQPDVVSAEQTPTTEKQSAKTASPKVDVTDEEIAAELPVS